MEKTRNDLTTPVPRLCLALEEHRRTTDGRVRSSHEFMMHFFPHDANKSEDRLFKFMPNDVRGPILAAWGIRGSKAAMRDTDEKVQSVVYDALVAGDLEHAGFEQGLAPDVVVRWSPLADFWSFWRGGKLSKNAIQKALVSAYELGLFDAKWFLDTIDSRGGKLRGTDVLADGLTKDDLTEWLRNVHQAGDGSPRGLIASLGWEKIVAKTTNDVLIAVLDAMVLKVGLVKPATTAKGDASSAGGSTASTTTSVSTTGASAATPAPSSVAASPTQTAGTGTSSENKASVRPDDMDWNEPESKSQRPTYGGESPVENMPTIATKGDLAAAGVAPAPAALAFDDNGAASEDIIVVDEDELSTTDTGPSAPREEPPTSPRMETARPVAPEEPPEASLKGISKPRSERASVNPSRSGQRSR